MCNAKDETFTDPRDGRVYRTVKIGDQVWMAENLNYDAPGSKCYEEFYARELKSGEKYGRVYDWETANRACPPGWHLPSNDEWDVLINFVGGEKIAGKHLKAKSGWADSEGESGNGMDTYGFAALPGGIVYSGLYLNFNLDGLWWSSSEYDSNDAYCWNMLFSYEGAWCDNLVKEEFLCSVRCVQD